MACSLFFLSIFYHEHPHRPLLPYFSKVVTALVQLGTLRPGAVLVSGTTYAKVRALTLENRSGIIVIIIIIIIIIIILLLSLSLSSHKYVNVHACKCVLFLCTDS